MKKLNLLLAATLFLVTIMPSCDHRDHLSIEKPFDIKEHFIAGTNEPLKGAYFRSIYFIKFLEDNKAAIIDGRQVTLADYVLTKDSLIVSYISEKVPKSDSMVYKFSLDMNKNITSSFYKSFTMESKSSGRLFPVKDSNLLAGKVFKGEEFKWSSGSFNKNWYYKFSSDGKTYGTGNDINTIDDKAYPYELINAIGFRSKQGNYLHLGYVTDSLTTFRVGAGGFYFFGKYGKQ